MDPLPINVSDLVKSSGSEKRIKETIEPSPFRYYQKELRFLGPVDVDLVLSNIGDRILAKGCVRGKVELGCGRCLSFFGAGFCLDIEDSFCLPNQCRGEEDIFEIVDNRINLGPLIDQALVLWLPMKQLCKVDCKGLCAKCGKNLNYEHCSCEKEEVDPRLRVLGDFFEK